MAVSKKLFSLTFCFLIVVEAVLIQAISDPAVRDAENDGGAGFEGGPMMEVVEMPAEVIRARRGAVKGAILGAIAGAVGGHYLSKHNEEKKKKEEEEKQKNEQQERERQEKEKQERLRDDAEDSREEKKVHHG